MAAVAALALASAVVVSDSGPNQAAHFALVRALASGTAEIDPGETIDAAYIDGHYYAAKAPGLAMFTLPWYGALRAVGLQGERLATESGYRHRVWELTLFGSVLPFVALLLLMLAVVERVVPGYGLPTSVLLGAGTLLLPFSTLFFDHLLSAALGFAAFTILLLERDGVGGTWLLAAGGLLAGLAVVVEFPLAVVLLVLGVYAVAGARVGPVRRGAWYAVGALAGVLPLLAYNTWAFGSPTTLGYTNALKRPVGTDAPVVGANAEGFYGVGVPDLRVALSLLVSEKGLLVVTPLAVVALVGLPLLWRAGRRAEALVCAVLSFLFLAYNAAYYLPFGGQAPGPRFLVPIVPFLALPLALALKARPLVVAGVGVASAAVMALATIAGPLTGVEYGIGTWLDRLGSGDLVETLPGRLGVAPAWVAALPFATLLAAALIVAIARLPLRNRLSSELPLLAGALGAWLIVVLAAPDLLPADEQHGTLAGSVAVLFLLGAVAVTLHLVRVWGPAALLLLVPALVLAAPQLAGRPRWSLLVAVFALAAASSSWYRLHRSRPS